MSLDPVKVADTTDWFKKASNDLRSAELLVADITLVDEAAFHCQQAVEKSLKGFLYWNNRPLIKTHDLNILSAECLRIDATLQQVLGVGIAPLSQYAVEYRYPGPLTHPTENEVKELIRISELVYDTLKSKLPFQI